MRDRHSMHRITRHAVWTAVLTLLVILSGCSSETSSLNKQPAGSTTTPTPQPPIVLAPNPTSALSPTSGVTGANRTMYHRDLARTGYDANEPDPASLAQAWKTPLNGVVYAEPLSWATNLSS